MEKLILADGWILKSQVGSHRQYIHPTKKVKLRFLYIQKT
ncbi:type II toxin-antitoxin system HicA family toxin [Faecalitalea cylindroides]|nr:type II toxin-antitoxin system HicA family toxin [Faecalitalea cylindroides]